MDSNVKQKGALIALAWPETLIPQENKWYDPFMKSIGILRGGHYRAGHSALILIEYTNNTLHYFDFGRYHTPYQHGRVRDSWSDPDLKLSIKAKVSPEGELLNLKDILLLVSSIKACHGNGRLEASVAENINFEKAYSFAKRQQSRGAIKYGPLEFNGTNCSRFVAATGRASELNIASQIALRIPYTVSPSPMLNVKVIGNTGCKYVVKNDEFAIRPALTSYLKMIITGRDMKTLNPQYT